MATNPSGTRHLKIEVGRKRPVRREALPAIVAVSKSRHLRMSGRRLQRLDQLRQRVQPLAQGHEIGILLRQGVLRQRRHVAADEDYLLLRRSP